MLPRVKQKSNILEIQIPCPHTSYLESLARKDSFEELWSLFRFADKPMKELTESYSAYKHTGNWKKLEDLTVIHVGDGAHCRTGAMFALLTKHNNISIDPNINIALVNEWVTKFNIQRLKYYKGAWQDVINFDNKVIRSNKALLCFTHAHVNSWDVVTRCIELGMNVVGAYVSACCQPNHQLTLPVRQFDDWGILSPERTCQLWSNAFIPREGWIIPVTE